MHVDEVQIIEDGSATPIELATIEEEDNPGELVSIWYAMKKQYEQTMQSLMGAAAQLNEIGDVLRSKHGIEVPRVAQTVPSLPSPVATLTTYDQVSVETAPQNDATSWSPPYQQPIAIATPQTSVKFIEALRSDSALGENEKGFADHIGKMLSSFQGFGGS